MQNDSGIPSRPDFVECLRTYASWVPDGSIIVEIGTNFGESTVALACGIHGTRSRIICIDPVFRSGTVAVHNGDNDEDATYNSNVQNFINRLTDRNLSHYVSVVSDFSHKFFPKWDLGEIALIFIDGEHTFDGVMRDCQWLEHVASGGYAVFDDWMKPVQDAVDVYIQNKPWKMLHENTSPQDGDMIVTILQKSQEGEV